MILELRNICKTYMQGRYEVPVLQGISLSVEEGEYLAIMGPSGSGKTTLMNIIGCLDNPSSGEYILEGQDIARISEKHMSDVRLRSIGFVFQSFYLLSRQTALDNVALPLLYAGVRKRERQQIARRALERVGLGDRTDFKPTQLSGGQCQRVAIARAIVNNPKLILADEPTGALDTKSGDQIMEIFKSLNAEGVTIVMITHEPEIAAHAKRTLHIRDGLLVDGGGRPLSPPPAPADMEDISSREEPADAPQPAGPAEESPVPEPAAEKEPAPEAPEKAGPLKELTAQAARQAGHLTHWLGQAPELLRQAPQLLKKLPLSGKKAEEAPTDPVEKPESSPVEASPPERAPSEPDAPAETAQEESISGESIIAALERQQKELEQNGGEGKEAEHE